jgi:hypothetical protein
MQMLVDIAFFMFGAAAAGLLGLIVWNWYYNTPERTYTAYDLKDYYGEKENDFSFHYYTPTHVEEKATTTRRVKRNASRKKPVRKPSRKSTRRGR